MDCADVEKPKSTLTFSAGLTKAAADSGRSYFDLLKEIAKLRFSRGRLSFDDYCGLRLYDNNLYKDADKKAFAGFRVTQKICLRANYRFDAFGLVNNKTVADILLNLYGFPIMPTMAIFRDGIGRKAPFLLKNEDELRTFLINSQHYPLFGKPVSGCQSIGTASIDHYDAASRRLITTMGHGMSLDTFVSYVKAHSAYGYIFQKRVSPHAVVRKLCGDRLATLRLLTIMTEGKPRLFRACWKIPAGLNTADNFWRPGNLLAGLDLDSGRVLRVIRQTGTGFEEITHHPDTGVCIVGTMVPNWQEITLLALQGAKLFEEVPLAGWDIAPVDTGTGAVIVEINEVPDSRLHQLADRCGLLDAEFMNFLAERKHHAADWVLKAKEPNRFITELVPQSSVSPHVPLAKVR